MANSPPTSPLIHWVFTTYPPAYFSPEASGKNLLIGANFEFAGAGLDERTSIGNVNQEAFQTNELQLNSSKEFKGPPPGFKAEHRDCIQGVAK
ncbi:hypothetical protein L2E82_07062 [Cichorium intybus]|uniref:Uncharacterized protein n=1 Tax=Cichorium intybus TaxID=13427 RepID=A0ACB9G3U2_CICIN|nr:hypothetical protein L2E82_07062 [Cichorium intybus]